MNTFYNFSDEFYTIPFIDIFRLFSSGFFIGIGSLLLIQLYYQTKKQQLIIKKDSRFAP